MAFIDDVNKKKQHLADRAKEKSDKRDSMSTAQAQLAATLAGSERVSKAIRESDNKVKKVEVTNPQKVEVKHKIDNKPVIEAMNAVREEVKKLKLNPTIKVSPTEVTVPEVNLKPLLDAISKLEMSPIINVAPPEVHIPETKIDLSPIANAMPKQVKRISIEDFRAQDMDEEEQGIQYVGFVAPNGNWMIIRNDVEGNNMRYKFGKKDYAKAWPKLATFKYETLDKAYNEIKT